MNAVVQAEAAFLAQHEKNSSLAVCLHIEVTSSLHNLHTAQRRVSFMVSVQQVALAVCCWLVCALFMNNQ